MSSENASTAGVFADRAVLSPEYVPDRLVGREEELANVEYALNPMIFGREPDDVLVSGPCGAGKTVSAKYSAQRQTRYAREQGLAAGWVYVDCLRASTEPQLLRAAADGLNDTDATGIEIPDSGLSTGAYRDRLRAILESTYDAAMIVLDGLDHIADAVAVPPGGGLESCVVSHIGIVDGDPAGRLGVTRETLVETEQRFDRYDAGDLGEILRDRRDAFAEGRLDPAALDRAATLAAARGGDAAAAIAMLRVAGERVREGGETTVGPGDVTAAADRVDHLLIREQLAGLTDHGRLVALALARLTGEYGYGSFSTRRIHEAYAAVCRERGREPRTERRVLDFLDEQARLGLTDQGTHWGGRADGNYKTHRLRTRQVAIDRALGASDENGGCEKSL